MRKEGERRACMLLGMSFAVAATLFMVYTTVGSNFEQSREYSYEQGADRQMPLFEIDKGRVLRRGGGGRSSRSSRSYSRSSYRSGGIYVVGGYYDGPRSVAEGIFDWILFYVVVCICFCCSAMCNNKNTQQKVIQKQVEDQRQKRVELHRKNTIDMKQQQTIKSQWNDSVGSDSDDDGNVKSPELLKAPAPGAQYAYYDPNNKAPQQMQIGGPQMGYQPQGMIMNQPYAPEVPQQNAPPIGMNAPGNPMDGPGGQPMGGQQQYPMQQQWQQPQMYMGQGNTSQSPMMAPVQPQYQDQQNVYQQPPEAAQIQAPMQQQQVMNYPDIAVPPIQAPYEAPNANVGGYEGPGDNQI